MMNSVVCGDCLEVMRDMPDDCVDLVLTDPPYGIDFQSARRIDKYDWKPKIVNDKEPFVEWIKDAYRILKPTGRLICFYRWDVQEKFLAEIIRSGFNPKSQIIWDKISHGMGDLKGEFAPQHESILYATKERYEFHGKRPTSIIQCMRVMPDKLVHPNEKPLPLLRKIIRNLTKESNIVLDCFLGSGALAVACHYENRNYIGIEISKEYCEIARKRIQEAKDSMGLFK